MPGEITNTLKENSESIHTFKEAEMAFKNQVEAPYQ
jgi:hypothetical protein